MMMKNVQLSFSYLPFFTLHTRALNNNNDNNNNNIVNSAINIVS